LLTAVLAIATARIVLTVATFLLGVSLAIAIAPSLFRACYEPVLG
jgi:hypothetical protein